MKRAMILLILLASAACHQKRTFDERYSDTANTIGNRANSLDSQLNQAQSNSSRADHKP